MCDRLLIHFMTDEHYMPRWSAYLSPSSQRLAFLYWGPSHPPARRGRCGQMCLSNTKNRSLFKERCRRGTAGGNTCQHPNVTSLTGRHAWLICGERWTAFCFKCFVSKRDEAVLSFVSEKRAKRRDPGESGGPFIAENDSEMWRGKAMWVLSSSSLFKLSPREIQM